MFGWLKRKRKKKNAEPTIYLYPNPAEPRDDSPTEQAAERPRFLTASATHVGTREYQQDALYVTESDARPVFGILCDGMGGMENGEKASADVVEFMANRIAALPDGAEVAPYLVESVRAANSLLLERYGGGDQGPGTTLVAVILLGERLHWVSVGDSRIYIIRGDEMVQVTRDHNYALRLQEQVEAGTLTQEEADGDQKREMLVSYLGAPRLDLIDANREPFPLLPEDLVLLCSDGLTKTLSDGRILELLAAGGGDLEETARQLPLTAFDESPGGQDNTSVILIRYRGLRYNSLNEECGS